jgi:ribosomal protein L44E
MIDGQFSAKIMEYLSKSERNLDEALLEEAANRCKAAFKRQLMEERISSKGKLRMSGGGHCARKQWYGYQGEQGEALSPRTINTFLMGDICEVGISTLARLAGWKFKTAGVEHNEVQTQIEIIPHRGDAPQEPFLIKGHVDDILIVPEEEKIYAVEYKSASEYSYKDFETNGLSESFGYRSQVSLYLDALGLDEAIVVYMCKNTGHICDRVVKKDTSLIQQAKENWRKILNYPEAADRKFDSVPETFRKKPTGRQVLPYQCSYCQFVKQCRPDAVLEFSCGKPVFVVSQEVAS